MFLCPKCRLNIRYEIPGVFLNQKTLDMDGESLPKLPMMPSDVPGLNLYFLVSMEPMPGGKTLNCGLEIQACVNTSVVDNEMVRRLHGDEMCVINKPIFNDTEIPVPECEETYPAKVLVGEMCNVNEIGQCGEHMTCVQVKTVWIGSRQPLHRKESFCCIKNHTTLFSVFVLVYFTAVTYLTRVG